MTATTLFRQVWRESRGSRAKLAFFIACLTIGVAAVVAVASSIEGLDHAVRGQARQLLAADLAVRGRHPVPDELKDAVDRIPGARRTDVYEMLTLVAAAQSDDGTAGRSRLVELKCLDGEYPFYGELELDPPGSLADLLDADSTLVEATLLSRLEIEVGDDLRIGGASFRIAGRVVREPDRIAGAFSMGPRVFLSVAGLERAGLRQAGSTIFYRTLVRLPAADEESVAAVSQDLEPYLAADGRHRIETYSEAQPVLRQGLRRLERFLGLAALLSLLIGGVGVAQTVRAWLAGRMDAIAVLKCLGYRPREVLGLYLGQVAVLGLAGSALGIALGLGVHAAALRLMDGILPVSGVEVWQPWAALRGLVLGTGIGILFSLPPLAAARRVPPIRVLRRDAEPLPPSRVARLASAGLLVAAVLVLAAWQARSTVWGALFTGGLLALTALLSAAARGLIRIAARPRPRRRSRLWLRQGLAALHRPGASTVGAVVALGLGVLVVLAMVLVQDSLDRQLRKDLPALAPTAFFIDIQPDQWSGVETLLADRGAERIDSVPQVMARFSAIDGMPVEEMADLRKPGRDRWSLRREQRLTWLAELPEDNEIIAGELWQRPDLAEVSVEQEYAEELGIGLGSVLSFDVQGVELDLHVTSLRTVDWSSFGINFFLVVEPGVLDGAPQNRIAAARLPREREQTLQDALADAFPNVTMIGIREILDRIAGILRQLSLGVRLLGGLTVLAGLAILAGAVSAGSIRRGNEVALLKTLGMTRRQVMSSFATEYALVGLVAGLIGSLGGGVLAWLVVTRGMEIDWALRPGVFLIALLSTVFLAVVAGLASSVPALRSRPVEALRSAG